MRERKVKSFERYAEYYDLIYQDKDYEKEYDFIEEIFQNFSSNPVKTIFDGGCGTGGHAIPLAKRGYQIAWGKEPQYAGYLKVTRSYKKWL